MVLIIKWREISSILKLVHGGGGAVHAVYSGGGGVVSPLYTH